MAIAISAPSLRPSTSSSTSSSSSSLLTSSNGMPTTPATATTRYIRSGIGGAGNWHKASTIPPAASRPLPPSLQLQVHDDPLLDDSSSPTPLLTRYHLRPTVTATATATATQTHVKSGIGGAGNIHAVSPHAALAFEEELARSRRAVVERSACASSFHVGIGGVGNFRAARGGRKMGNERVIRGQRSAGALGLGMKRSEGDLRVEASAVGVALPRAVGRERERRRVSWGEESVEEFEVQVDEGDGGKDGVVYYSTEPLPYGALDILRRRLERAFARGGREVLATPAEKGRAVQVGGEHGQERRFLRSHRSMWRF